jgi:hypothetical protein
VVSDQDPDRAIVAQAEKASRSAGQLDYLPHACVSSGIAALYDSDFKKLMGSCVRRFVVGVWALNPECPNFPAVMPFDVRGPVNASSIPIEYAE